MDRLEDILPLIIPIMIFAIPIIAVLSKHQQRMAQILNTRQDHTPELMAIRQELASLRDHMSRQTIAIDNLERNQRSLPESEIRSRLET